MSAKQDPRRLQLIKLIHVARRELNMEDADYRAMLASMPALGGKTSSADLGLRGLELVLDALVSRGFKVRPKAPGNTNNRRLASDPQSRLVRHLWLKLHGLGKVRDSSESALNHYVERLTKVADLHWLSNKQITTVIESLKSWIDREDGPHETAG